MVRSKNIYITVGNIFMSENPDVDSERVKRRRKIKEDVEKRVEKMSDFNGISTLGTFKSDQEMREFIRKKRLKR